MEPLDVLLTSVRRLRGQRIEPVLVLRKKGHAVRRQPQVMNGRGAQPPTAGMIRIVFLVAARIGPFLEGSRGKSRGSRGVMARIEQLTGFQQHLDDVFIDGVARRFSRAPVKEEDIHAKGGQRMPWDFNFFTGSVPKPVWR